jgi:hypothetical protein
MRAGIRIEDGALSRGIDGLIRCRLAGRRLQQVAGCKGSTPEQAARRRARPSHRTREGGGVQPWSHNENPDGNQASDGARHTIDTGR